MKAVLGMMIGMSPVAERAIPAVDDSLPERFRRVYRHSRRVRLLRKLVPASIALAAVGSLAVSLLAPLAQIHLPFNAGKLSMNGTILTMETPRLSGYTRNSNAYRVVAAEARQDLAQSNIVEMKTVRAEFETANGGITRINAAEGTADTSGNKLQGRGGIEVVTSTGFHGFTEAADVDSKNGSVSSRGPVSIETPTGHIDADHMDILDEGTVFLFSGQVRGYFRTAEADPDLETASEEDRTARVLSKKEKRE